MNDVRACPALRVSTPGRLATSQDDLLPSLVLARANVFGSADVLRWGLFPPTAYIPVAKEPGQSYPIGPGVSRPGFPSSFDDAFIPPLKSVGFRLKAL